MIANSKKVLHVDTTHFPVYGTSDLNYFQSILDDIMIEYGSVGRLSDSDRQNLRVRLAAALFKGAEAGDRDYERLKQRAIEAVSAVPSSEAGT